MPDYKKPGVYVEEISSLPSHVVGVATAIPAFFGYTDQGPSHKPVRIENFLDFEQNFGGSFIPEIKVQLNSSGHITHMQAPSLPPYLLHSGLQHFYENGGGPCYVISLGKFDDRAQPESTMVYADALKVISDVDEVTLLVLAEALSLPPAAYYQVVDMALTQCATLRDRFCIIDLHPGERYDSPEAETEFQMGQKFRQAPINGQNLSFGAIYTPFLETDYPLAFQEKQVTVVSNLAAFTQNSITIHNAIKARLNQIHYTLPPSFAIAGIYAQVDATRGVWKAPANVSVSRVGKPTVEISLEAQESLNVDPKEGKSINAIRNFPGKGTLVWGARTLAGNDNEWRYVPTRRTFIMIEESIMKSTTFAVFEPNDANTWLKVKAMIESYLYGLWQQGALAGTTPESGFFVNVGLGKTMTAQDILEGRLIVEVGVAVVRPAEFITLTLVHEMQQD